MGTKCWGGLGRSRGLAENGVTPAAGNGQGESESRTINHRQGVSDGRDKDINFRGKLLSSPELHCGGTQLTHTLCVRTYTPHTHTHTVHTHTRTPCTYTHHTYTHTIHTPRTRIRIHTHTHTHAHTHLNIHTHIHTMHTHRPHMHIYTHYAYIHKHTMYIHTPHTRAHAHTHTHQLSLTLRYLQPLGLALSPRAICDLRPSLRPHSAPLFFTLATC
ncbi:hypothetical protein ANANG_G00189000 [Anguilla anguilla]|uniref:Uncharacterized protein n=1 Tax=Anguilla anguilla TaxID=7936 RepID=A0A9D3M0Q5_ANGAN|nr:hypothetical protein ANANG_G00189000 [Anguilla anguilla]